jgi:hypothetical protein
MSQPFGDARYKLLEAANSTLRLGVMVDSELDLRPVKLIMFTLGNEQYSEIDALYFHRTATSMRPFAWDHFADSEAQTRDQVKSRLCVLGFDPRIVDSAFPMSADERWNREHMGDQGAKAH